MPIYKDVAVMDTINPWIIMFVIITLIVLFAVAIMYLTKIS